MEPEMLALARKAVRKGMTRSSFEQLAAWSHDQVTDGKYDIRSNDIPQKTEWECPINYPNCKRNCGSYGCGN